MRTVGVEEELLLVDAASGRPRSVSGRILENLTAAGDIPVDDGAAGGSMAQELQQQQLETDTMPHTQMSELGDDIRAWRDMAIAGARESDARVIASGTSPLPVEPRLVRDARFEKMAEHYGLTTSEHMTCACHVHVSVESDDEAVGVLDHLRGSLPTLLAISSNSPFWQGEDTGYASFRSQAMVRWPTAGPNDVLGSAEEYRSLVAAMIASGVVLDEGMLYFDVRLSHHLPTVEIRVADVCLDSKDTLLIAALCRALVDTASRDWHAGEAPPRIPASLLRLANWQAGRHGIESALLSPRTLQPEPAHAVIREMVDHVREALQSNGDEGFVESQLDQVLTRGTGATRQRTMLEKTGQLTDVVADLARVTAGQDG